MLKNGVSKIIYNGKTSLKFKNGKVFAIDDEPTTEYTTALAFILKKESLNCPYVKADLALTEWAPVRDYRTSYSPNRVPETEDIFGFCNRDGKFEVNNMHQFKTNLGYEQLSPYLHSKLLSKLTS